MSRPVPADPETGASEASPVAPSDPDWRNDPDAALVVFMMGQSNLFGQGSNHSDVTNPEYSITPADTFIWSKISTSTPFHPIDDGAFVPLTTGFGFQNPPGSNPDAIGSELMIAHEIDAFRSGKPVYFIKCARGGSSIALHILNFEWSVDSVNELVDVWREYYYEPAIQDLYAAGKNPYLFAVFWGQGASDASTIAPPNAAENYGFNLTRLMGNIRTTISLPNAPFVVQRETDLPPNQYPGTPLVRQAQEMIAKVDPYVVTFDTDSRTEKNVMFYEKWDSEHFTGNGQRDFGRDAAGHMISLESRHQLQLMPLPQ
ncbi:MAG: sialate O-acetylesterase [bacterium]|nr:sialate O-acetylesterase [bacterium]